MTLREHLAKLLRALPDDELVEAAAPWLAARIESAVGTQSAPPHGETAEAPVPSRKPRAAKPAAKPARRAKTKTKAAPVRRGGPSDENVEKVAKILMGSPVAMKPSDIAARAGLDKSQTRYALVRLRAKGRAFNAGLTVGARWGVTQEAADEAAAR